MTFGFYQYHLHVVGKNCNCPYNIYFLFSICRYIYKFSGGIIIILYLLVIVCDYNQYVKSMFTLQYNIGILVLMVISIPNQLGTHL